MIVFAFFSDGYFSLKKVFWMSQISLLFLSENHFFGFSQSFGWSRRYSPTQATSRSPPILGLKILVLTGGWFCDNTKIYVYLIQSWPTEIESFHSVVEINVGFDPSVLTIDTYIHPPILINIYLPLCSK